MTRSREKRIGTSHVVESDGPLTIEHTEIADGYAYHEVFCSDCSWSRKTVHLVDAQDAYDQHDHN